MQIILNYFNELQIKFTDVVENYISKSLDQREWWKNDKYTVTFDKIHFLKGIYRYFNGQTRVFLSFTICNETTD